MWGCQRWRIIGIATALLALLTGGCSTLRVAYSTAPQLAWWWVDGYLDFGSEQSPAVKTALDRWFDWHRSSQLPLYVAWLDTVQAQVAEPQSAQQMCRFNEQARSLLNPALERALAQAAELAGMLNERNLQHLEQRFAKNLKDMRDDYLQPDATKRREKSEQRALERAEQLYGRLGEEQRRLLLEGVAASPFDPSAWYQERQRRQRDVVQTLRRLVAERADGERRLAALRVLVERSERSPDAAYRAYQQRLTDYNCAFAARLHNATTPVQRQAARERLRGWEEDLRSLVQPTPLSPALTGG